MDKDQPAHLKGPAGTETPRTCQFSMYQTNRNTYYRQRPNIVALQEFKKFCQCLWRCHRTRTSKQRQHFRFLRSFGLPTLDSCRFATFADIFCSSSSASCWAQALTVTVSARLIFDIRQDRCESSSEQFFQLLLCRKKIAIGTTVGFEMTSDLEAQFLLSLYQASP